MNKKASQIQDQTQMKAYPLIAPGILQRKCACGNPSRAGSECDACGRDRLNLQRHMAGSQSEQSDVPSIVHEVLGSPGRPLDAGTRAFMEAGFGHDFSQVRVHTDARSDESARAVNAIAYTVRQDLVFGGEQYQPQTLEGRRLLAHELAHVVQQREGDHSTLSISDADGPGEQQARSAASAVTSAQALPTLLTEPVQVAREEETGGGQAPVSTGQRPLAWGQVVQVEVRAGGTVEAMSHEYPIDVDGYIEIPPLGLVRANGLTQDQLAANLQAALADGYIVSPTVNVTLTSKIVAYGALITYPRVHLRIMSRSGDIETGSGDYPVWEDGTINLPYVGRIQARDRRLDVVEAEIEAMIRDGYIVEGVVHLTRQHLE